MQAFVQALLKEARYYAKQSPSNMVETAYFGGGTPSMLSPKYLRELFEGLHSIFDFSQAQEVTLEANPATFQLPKAQLFQALGVSRVSLGIQSFHNEVLSTLGREHNREQAIESVELLRQAHLPEINIDLMFSIPGQSSQTWLETLQTALSLQPDHISAYNLTYEEDTEFIERLTKGEYSESDDTNAQHFTLAHQTLTKAGYQHYETSNYAKPKKESQHNLSYWLGKDYLGIGPSAVSTIQQSRWKNTPDTAEYIRQISHVGHAKTEEERISQEAYRLERIALLLRTKKGLPLKWLDDIKPEKIQHICEENLATIQQQNLVLKQDGCLLVDSIVEHLLS